MDRRTFLKLTGASALAAPRLSFARTGTEQRLVVVVLRGGLDALHAVPPWADPDYQRLRPTLAVPPPGEAGGALALDDTFGLHPALAPLHPLFGQGELLVLHAATTSYRGRSHFDGQNQLENGTPQPFGARDGWLNRALAHLPRGGDRLGLALGPSVPLLLRGDQPVASWAESPLPEVDEDFLGRLARVYGPDPLFSATLAQARGSLEPSEAAVGAGGRGREAEQSARVAADMLARPDGPRLAVLEVGGWDTHFAQERRLSGLFAQLSSGMLALREGLGAHWKQTVVVVVSEFGRTAAENGSRGTDHGVGGLALVAGGAVRGGRVIGDWPGLRSGALHEGRDLRPTSAYESLFKGVLTDHMGLSQRIVEQRVFPESRELRPLRVV